MLKSGSVLRAGRILSAVAVIGLGLTATRAAQAQMPSFSMPEGVRISVGAAVMTMPRYEGASKYVVTALPFFKFAPIGGGFEGLKRFEAKNLDDLAFSLIKHEQLEIGVLTGYRFGRKEADAPHLWGTGDIKGSVVGGGFVKYNFGPMFVRASVHQSLIGDDTGAVLRLATGTKYTLSDRISIRADVWADAANETYMDSFFGVTRAQAVRSGLRMFDPGAGFKSVSAKLGTEVALTPDWTLDASVGYSRLIGDAADSPIVLSADRYDGRLGLSRAFDWRFR
jgi:MipA family protein